MVSQLELLTPAPAAQRHSETSKAAAERIEPDAKTLRGIVLGCIRRCTEYGVGGATDHEIQELTGLNPSTQRPRRIELVRMGLVVDSGKTRLTTSGRKATVWKAT